MKRFVVTYDYCWEAEFDIDVVKAAPACLESLDFFGDPIERGEGDEEIILAFLKFWTPHILRGSMHGTFEPMLSQIASWEGCFPMDGSRGIQFITCDTFEFDRDNIFIKQEEVP